jgi:hypothetical protein
MTAIAPERVSAGLLQAISGLSANESQNPADRDYLREVNG